MLKEVFGSRIKLVLHSMQMGPFTQAKHYNIVQGTHSRVAKIFLKNTSGVVEVSVWAADCA